MTTLPRSPPVQMLEWFIRWRRGNESPEEDELGKEKEKKNSEKSPKKRKKKKAANNDSDELKSPPQQPPLQTPSPPPLQRKVGLTGKNILEKLTQPPLGEQVESNTSDMTPEICEQFGFQGMAVGFLGTASGSPSPTRNTQAIAVKLHGRTFLFDCSEGTQHRILGSPLLHPGQIDRIFITHMHGDHVLGLPGVVHAVCSNATPRGPLEVYGPPGVRRLLRTVIDVVGSRLPRPFLVHELSYPRLDSVPEEDRMRLFPNWRARDERAAARFSVQVGRGRNERNIVPNAAGVWDVFEDDTYSVRAVNLRHTLPCWGYVLRERDRRGPFDVSALTELGLSPGPEYAELSRGHSITLPSGRVVSPDDVMSPPMRGRKLVILGDTSLSDNMLDEGRDADVLVHECTLDDHRQDVAIARGHSTPSMAGNFARRLRARTLIATHFSNKYVDDSARPISATPHHNSSTPLGYLMRAAEKAFRGPVVAAKDYLWVNIPYARDKPVQLSLDDGRPNNY